MARGQRSGKLTVMAGLYIDSDLQAEREAKRLEQLEGGCIVEHRFESARHFA